ncbi:hypothetical protein BYT27DRAFT_7148643 [Phlegmacium glaucopus]|nr:hypothetical protein BYT27DRAFT_7148643 [Phlegmacium glaucopus]
MSELRVTEDRRLSAKPFANVVGMVGLPDIIHPPSPSMGPSPVASTSSESGHILGQDEPCFVTKTIRRYTHKQMYWVGAVKMDKDHKADVESLLKGLGVVYHAFHLEDPTNVANFDLVIHNAMNPYYAFIAFTTSLDTLDGLISTIQCNNDARQQIFDSYGMHYPCIVDCADCFLDPTYELVALHPEHFLPPGRHLSIYDHSTTSWKSYVVASDRMLRETQDPSSPSLPAFSHSPACAPPTNPFLVILNAYIKFQRYNRIQPAPPPLPPHVVQLMTKTNILVSLLYWTPEIRPNTKGAQIHELNVKYRQQNQVPDAEMDEWSSEESDDGL